MEERMQQKCDDSTEDIFKTVLYLFSMQKCVLASMSLSCFYVAPQCLNVAGDSVFPTRTNWDHNFSHNNSWILFNQNPTFMILEQPSCLFIVLAFYLFFFCEGVVTTLESPALIRAACVSYLLILSIWKSEVSCKNDIFIYTLQDEPWDLLI